jgi:dodecin
MGVTKVIEVVGISSVGSDEAVREAVRAASRSIRGVSRVDVISITCDVADNDISQWHALVKISFPVESK